MANRMVGTAVEYAVLIVLIAVVCLAAVAVAS